MNSDEVEHLHELLKIHKRRVNVLEQQAAKYGINCPPEIKLEIEDLQEQIAHFESNLQGNVIQSYLQGRETLSQFNREMDSVTNGLSKVVVEEKRIYRFFGLPVWSVVISRTILTLLVLVVGIGMGLALPQPDRTALEQSAQQTAMIAFNGTVAAVAAQQRAVATQQAAITEKQAAVAAQQVAQQTALSVRQAVVATQQAAITQKQAIEQTALAVQQAAVVAQQTDVAAQQAAVAATRAALELRATATRAQPRATPTPAP